MKIGFYPGCSLNGTSREYNESVKAVVSAFGIEPVELDDWNCCGASAAHALDKDLSVALPVRILAIAERQGLEELLVPCAACYNHLMVAQHEMHNDQKLEDKILPVVGLPYQGTVKILNVLQFLEKYVIDRLPEKVTQPFARKVTCYYGCLLTRPAHILRFDRPEDPQSMDSIMSLIGATPMDWGFKTECCGAGLSVSRTDLVARLSGNIMRDANDRGAEAMIVACPMCHSNLDMRRPDINRYLSTSVAMPVLYITQAIGLAIGLTPKALGIERHFVNVNFKSATVCQE